MLAYQCAHVPGRPNPLLAMNTGGGKCAQQPWSISSLPTNALQQSIMRGDIVGVITFDARPQHD
jgi:hypothetical protein